MKFSQSFRSLLALPNDIFTSKICLVSNKLLKFNTYNWFLGIGIVQLTGP